MLTRSQTPPLPDNTLIFTFASDPESRFYQQQASVTKETDTASAASETELAEDRKRRVALGRDIVRTAVERSLRETRMKKGPGIGALHQYVSCAEDAVFQLINPVDSLTWKQSSLIRNAALKSSGRRLIACCFPRLTSKLPFVRALVYRSKTG